MNERITTFSRLAQLRARQVSQVMGRVNYQQGLCQRYRDNIQALHRLSGFTAPLNTPLQRHNHQQYKATLHSMINVQQRELSVAEGSLARIREQLLQALRSEQVVVQVMTARVQEWQLQLARQEQKIQDGLAAQCAWRQRWG